MLASSMLLRRSAPSWKNKAVTSSLLDSSIARRFKSDDAGDVIGIDLGTTNSCVAIMVRLCYCCVLCWNDLVLQCVVVCGSVVRVPLDLLTMFSLLIFSLSSFPCSSFRLASLLLVSTTFFSSFLRCFCWHTYTHT